MFLISLQFAFQYGVCLQIYVNIRKYVAIVSNSVTHQPPKTNWKCSLTVTCMTYPCIMAMLDLVIWDTVTYGHVTVCQNRLITLNYTAFEVMGWLKIVSMFVIPLCVIIFCNCMIARRINQHIGGIAQIAHAARLRRAAALPIVTTAMFIICWLPLVCSAIYMRLNTVTCNMGAVMNICTMLGHMYCVTNPLAYIYTARARIRNSSTGSISRTPPLLVCGTPNPCRPVYATDNVDAMC